jgi:hypothetical protein
MRMGPKGEYLRKSKTPQEWRTAGTIFHLYCKCLSFRRLLKTRSKAEERARFCCTS